MAKRKLTQVEKNQLKLVNKLSKAFRETFPALKKDKHFAPLKIRDIEKRMNKEQ